MSLWRYRRKLVLAVAGELAGQAELKLRAHLQGCEACRSHYNTLSQLAAVSDTRTAAQRQRARLLAGLPVPPTAATPRVRRWVWALPVLAPALMALLWLGARPLHIDEPIAWRGGAEPAGWPLSLLLYEFPQGANGPPVVLGELPFSRGIRVARDTLVQLAYAKLQKPTFVFVVGEQDSKQIVLYPRRPQDEGPLAPEPRAKALGASLKLHAAFHPGPLRVWVVTSASPLAQAQAVAALASGKPTDSNGLQVFAETVRLLP